MKIKKRILGCGIIESMFIGVVLLGRWDRKNKLKKE